MAELGVAKRIVIGVRRIYRRLLRHPHDLRQRPKQAPGHRQVDVAAGLGEKDGGGEQGVECRAWSVERNRFTLDARRHPCHKPCRANARHRNRGDEVGRASTPFAGQHAHGAAGHKIHRPQRNGLKRPGPQRRDDIPNHIDHTANNQRGLQLKPLRVGRPGVLDDVFIDVGRHDIQPELPMRGDIHRPYDQPGHKRTHRQRQCKPLGSPQQQKCKPCRKAIDGL